MPMIRVANVGIHVQEWGAGEPLMMVHGLGASGDLWINQVPTFAEHYRVIAVDLRGFGRSDRPTGPGAYGIEVLAADVAAAARALGIRNMHYLGTSMGGFVGQMLALAEPTLCRSLVLCHTAFRMSIPQDVLQARVEMLRRAPMAEYARVVASQALAPAAAPALFDWIAQMIAQNDQRAYTQVLTESLQAFDVSDRVAQIRLPTLVIVGALDRVIPLEEGYELARRISGAEVVTLKRSGHIGYAEEPEQFNASVLRFLRRVDHPAARRSE